LCTAEPSAAKEKVQRIAIDGTIVKTKGRQKNEDSESRMLERGREALERKGNSETALLLETETSDPVYLQRGWMASFN
jgi:hypothetical protein